MVKEILTIGIGMVGEHPIGGKPKKQSGGMHPKIRKQWILFFAAIGIASIIGAALLNTPAQISSPSLAGPSQPGSNQPVTGSGAPSPTNTGQENKICVAYNNDPPYYSCKKYKAAPTNRLKNTWTTDEIDGTNINIESSSGVREIFEKLPTIYDDGTLVIKAAIIPRRNLGKNLGYQGVIAKNVGKETIKVATEVTWLDLTLEEQDAYPNGIKHNGEAIIKPGRVGGIDLYDIVATEKFQLNVTYLPCVKTTYDECT